MEHIHKFTEKENKTIKEVKSRSGKKSQDLQKKLFHLRNGKRGELSFKNIFSSCINEKEFNCKRFGYDFKLKTGERVDVVGIYDDEKKHKVYISVDDYHDSDYIAVMVVDKIQGYYLGKIKTSEAYKNLKQEGDLFYIEMKLLTNEGF